MSSLSRSAMWLLSSDAVVMGAMVLVVRWVDV